MYFVVNCQCMPYSELYTGYSIIIGCSSTLSVLWHRNKEPKNILFWLDYGLAGIWTIYDLLMAILLKPTYYIFVICLLNCIILITNYMVDYLDRTHRIAYVKGHTLWHILSAMKSIYVAYLLGCKSIL